MEKVKDWWSYGKKSVLKGTLIKRIKDFREDNIKAIPHKKIAALKEFKENENF